MPKLFFVLLCCFPLYAFSLPDPIEIENYFADNITAIHSATSLLNQATQIHNQIQMIAYEIKNSGKVAHYQWSNITQLIQRLDAITQQGQALSYAAANLDQQFQHKYPDYTNTATGPTNYSQTTKTWNTSTLDTLRGSLNAVATSADSFKAEQDSFKQLEQQGNNVQGRLQALQLLSEISVQQVNQMQALKRLISVQTNAQNAFMAYQVSKDSYEEKGLEEITRAFPTQFPRYRNNPHFGEISLQ